MLHPDHLQPTNLQPTDKIVMLANAWISEEKANNNWVSKIVGFIVLAFVLLFIGWENVILGSFGLLAVIVVILQNFMSGKFETLHEFDKEKINEIIIAFNRRINISYYYLGVGSILFAFYFLEKYTSLINLDLLPGGNIELSTEVILVLAFLAGGIFSVIKYQKRIKLVKEELVNITA